MQVAEAAMDAGGTDFFATCLVEGEMGELMRARDWASTSLGEPRSWPPALRTALSICMHSSVPTAIYWGPELRLLYNDAWSPIPAERHPDALGMPAKQVWTDIWPVIGPQFARVLATGQGFSTHDQMLPIRRDGVVHETYWTYSFTPIFDEDGRVAGIFNQGHETTAQVLAARAAVAETERLRQMFDQAPGFMAMLVGRDHVFELANDAYVRLIGDRPLIGRRLREALPEVERQGFVTLLDTVFETGQPHVGRGVSVDLLRAAGASETRFVDFIFQPVRDGAGKVAGIFVQGSDVTERVTAENELRDWNADLERRVATRTEELASANAQLRQSQKMEAVGQLTGGIAHDFNNLLTVILGSIDIARRSLSAGDEVRAQRALAQGAKGVDSAAALTARLLAFARRQSLAPKTIDLNDLIEGTAELIRRTLGETVELETALDPALPTVRVDPNQLENAILNLAVNGRDAMPDGGRLRVTTGCETLDAAAAEELELAPGTYATVTVEDCGSGMPAEVIARAIEPFFTTKAQGKGTGLGLSMVYGFAKQSGGSVSIDSAEGRGTAVRLFFPPASATAAVSAGGEARLFAGDSRGSESILIVEDQEAVGDLAAGMLGDAGYRVHRATDAAAALELLAQVDDVDLVFSDVVMPGGVSGIALAQQVRELRPGTEILLTTGYTTESVERADYPLLSKPYRRAELLQKVRRLLDERSEARTGGTG